MTTPPATTSQLPSAPGVYRFRDPEGDVLYIGRATSLRHRVMSYWGNLGDRDHLAPMVRRISRVEAVSCASPHEAAWLERNLLGAVLPPWNRSRGGEEVPVYIRLDQRPTAPRLSVVHTAGDAAGTVYFGPYLGGQKTRLAIAGLQRVLPLPYTGSRASGITRDMANKRSVSHLNRDSFVRTLTAVLERSPAAVTSVRDQLLALRERATTSLAFELAAQVQKEIEALAWITCTQRVTVPGSGEFDVCGWHSGVMVRFHVRDGRLNRWEQYASTYSGASAQLAGTPPAWREFAQRNAELAARLSGSR